MHPQYRCVYLNIMNVLPILYISAASLRDSQRNDIHYYGVLPTTHLIWKDLIGFQATLMLAMSTLRGFKFMYEDGWQSHAILEILKRNGVHWFFGIFSQ